MLDHTLRPLTFSLKLGGVHQLHHVLHIQLHGDNITVHQCVGQNRQKVIGTERLFQK